MDYKKLSCKRSNRHDSHLKTISPPPCITDLHY